MAEKALVRGSIIRALYGVLALFFPKLLLAGSGMTEEDLGAEARYFNRLFGGRDLLVAGATVMAVGPERQSRRSRPTSWPSSPTRCRWCRRCAAAAGWTARWRSVWRSTSAAISPGCARSARSSADQPSVAASVSGR